MTGIHAMPSSDSKVVDYCVIGGGACGSYLASLLNNQGHSLVLVEKSRGLGGRLATRRITVDGALMQPELGALCYSPPWRSELSYKWLQSGIIEAWGDDIWVLAGKNTQALRDLTQSIECQTQVRAIALNFPDKLGHWVIQCQANDQTQDTHKNIHAHNIVLAIPAPQAAELLTTGENIGQIDTNLIAQQKMLSRWTFVLAARGQVAGRPYCFPAGKLANGAIESIFQTSIKPGCQPVTDSQGNNLNAWHISASLAWSEKNIDCSKIDVEAELKPQIIDAIKSEFGATSIEHCESFQSHLWRYAHADSRLTPGYIKNARNDLWVAGDWLCGQNLDSAFYSAELLAQKIMG